MGVEAVSAAGSFLASIVALGIALRQHYAAQEVLRAAQRERATLVAVAELSADELLIRNLGQTPVFDLVIADVRAEVRERDGDDSYVIARARARTAVRQLPLLAPGEELRTAVHTWREWDEDRPLAPEDRAALGPPSVELHYRDAAGTRWKRQGNDLPRRYGGTPLPGTVRTRHRVRSWLGSRARALGRDLRLGFRGEGFTRQGRARGRRRPTPPGRPS